LLEPRLDRVVPLRSLPLDLLPLLHLGSLPFGPLTLEPLSHCFPAAAKRNHSPLATAEPLRRNRPAARSLIGDAIVPSEPHAAGV